MVRTVVSLSQADADDLAYLQRRVQTAERELKACRVARNRKIRQLDAAGVPNWAIARAVGMKEPQTHRIAAGTSGEEST